VNSAVVGVTERREVPVTGVALDGDMTRISQSPTHAVVTHVQVCRLLPV
jgi:hypothetical protein